MFQVRVGDDLEALQNGTGKDFTASAPFVRGSIPPTDGRYVLVWITQGVPADGANRAEIAEFVPLGTR